MFQAVSPKHLKVHTLEQASADVTEGTRAGPTVVWERCLYDWSHLDSVNATVIDSNIYASPGSSWEIRATPSDQGSLVEVIWVRRFKASPRGRLFGFLCYSRQILKSLEGQDLEGVTDRFMDGPTDRIRDPSAVGRKLAANRSLAPAIPIEFPGLDAQTMELLPDRAHVSERLRTSSAERTSLI